MKKKLIIDKAGKYAKFVDDEKEFCIPILRADVDTKLTDYTPADLKTEVTLTFNADVVEII